MGEEGRMLTLCSREHCLSGHDNLIILAQCSIHCCCNGMNSGAGGDGAGGISSIRVCSTVIESQRYSGDLLQSGLKVPCTLCFMGSSSILVERWKNNDNADNHKLRRKWNANQSSGTEITTCDSDEPSVFPYEKKTKALLLNDNKKVDEDKLDAHQPSSSNNLDFALLILYNVGQHKISAFVVT